MAFSFNKTPAPAPAGGGFSFGATPAPAAGAPAPFGAPAPGTPAPAPAGGGLFGTPAPATGGGLFGTPAPAPAAGGGLFGTPAPAPAAGGGGLFGAPAPAAPAAGGGLFGAPAPAAPAPGGFGAPGTPAAAQQPQQPLSGHTPYSALPENARRAIDSIHDLMMRHRRTMANVKCMAPALLSVPGTANAATSSSTGSGGALLLAGGGGLGTPAGKTGGIGVPQSPADAAAGPSLALKTTGGSKALSASAGGVVDPDATPLPRQLLVLDSDLRSLLGRVERCLADAESLRETSGRMATNALVHAVWPVEATASRRGVALTPLPARPSSDPNREDMERKLSQLLDVQAAGVDRIESIPSPYFWEVIADFEVRLATVKNGVEALAAQLDVAEEAAMISNNQRAADRRSGGAAFVSSVSGGEAATPAQELAAIVRSQSEAFLRVAASVARAHDSLEAVKAQYRRSAVGGMGSMDDPFLRADAAAAEEERRVQERIRAGVAAAASSVAPPAPAAQAGATPAGGMFGAPKPATGGLFGATPAPAPAAGGLFGSPAPAPAGGGLFGAPAPAPAGGGLFGAPAPAPAGGGLFGAPAPAGTGGLGLAAASSLANTPAPAFGASTFGAKPKSKSKSGSRRR